MDVNSSWVYNTSDTASVHQHEITFSQPSCTFEVEWKDVSIFYDEAKKIFEGVDKMMDLLTDLIFKLNLSEADVAVVKKIAKHGGWKDALLLYLLAKSVQDGLALEDLGFKEESE